ncbi:bifunctional indole-3-glycerol-phosphate synthase TrpC/phosphoribosylanthranilate isomerase TrpF [Candidatus Berkiella cookevillensis]|uniref:N-(5'-phosphoribosyl)anthranilate isomerase n=1 Tax=Candidatus Berkiella cookevillensis TaxID=437022 RepID=A0A0Q9YCT9_9GAMM|nr:bifunctional indole-3-glycerol-phosphate synthase TrpC/phosphoribosylanthranilate isomerase TrpF [Candidatus Berkiella cookevillensis]MCS5708176.1 bifunctional indole-3-glycerol-phosphate synthase TrpC/phosphoribosylanthranilate isomerase TrpF [Candidatus Berkiella cookevillensis]
MLSKIIETQKLINHKNEILYNHAFLKNNVKKSTKPFLKTHNKNKHHYIFECKKSSPSQGEINKNFNLISLIDTYNPFADAISVLTNEPFFEGKLEYLRKAQDHSSLALLCKDFILSKHQVLLARFFGADAILLMLSVLEDEDYIACSDLANQLNMAVLTEVHTEDELIRAIALNAPIIGINQRNLHDLSINKEIIYQLSPLIPKDRMIIAESGICSHEDIIKLKPYVNGFLIGTTLNQTTRPDLKLRELLFGRIKICGLTSQEAAIAAYQQGALYGGLNFISTSKRVINKEQALKIQQSAPLQYVAVFADQTIEYIVDMVNVLSLYIVQLHGHETQAYIDALRKKLPSTCQLWKAINGHQALPKELPFNIDKVIIDSPQDYATGGTNTCFNWEKLRDTAILEHSFIAGGLNVQNIKKAKSYASFGLDVNSGVETVPGIKDKFKLKTLLEQLR